MLLGDKSSTPEFGSVISRKMSIAWYRDGAWEPFDITDLAPLSLHPAAHVLHYASTCFEGMKAFRLPDREIYLFRIAKHLERMQNSARALALPIPDSEQLTQMICELVRVNRSDVPDPPGSLYIRPILIGTTPSLTGSSSPSVEACLYVMTSPVVHLFSGGERPLRIVVDDETMRATPHFGVVKGGCNYAPACRMISQAKRDFDADQVLFCPGGDVQECGGANFLLLNDAEILTKSLDDSFLHGVTRDSILVIAKELGYRIEERPFSIPELLERASQGEAALCGTAAILSHVGELIYRGEPYRVGSGNVGTNTQRLRRGLTDIHTGRAADHHGWLSRI